VLDIRLIRNEPDMVRAALRRRGPHAEAALDTLLELDRARREVLVAVEEKRGLRNLVSEEIAQAKRNKEDASAKIEAMRGVGEVVGSWRRFRVLGLASVHVRLRLTRGSSGLHLCVSPRGGLPPAVVSCSAEATQPPPIAWHERSLNSATLHICQTLQPTTRHKEED